MKGLTTLSVFAFFYLVIIIIFNEVGGEPRGVKDKNIGHPDSGEEALDKDLVGNGAKHGEDSSSQHEAKFGKVATDPSQKGKAGNLSSGTPIKNAQQRAAAVDPNIKPNKSDDTNPLADLFQIDDPTMRKTLEAVYGAYNGDDQCSRKAFCMMGNYMKDMPGRDLLFFFMGSYIPPEYSLYYEIFKVAVLYGQTCDVYVCVPNAPPPDAASAAARPSSPSATPPQKSQQPASPPQQQKPSTPPKEPASFFDNAFPR